jgi:hypothetical protein
MELRNSVANACTGAFGPRSKYILEETFHCLTKNLFGANLHKLLVQFHNTFVPSCKPAHKLRRGSTRGGAVLLWENWITLTANGVK